MQQGDADLVCLVEATAGATGEAFFAALSRSITKVFGVRHGLINRYLPELDEIEVLSWHDRDEEQEPFCYPTHGTPCAHVLEPNVVGVARDVAKAYPEDTFLAEANIEAYLGMPLVDSSGKVRGLLIAMHDEPLADLEPMKTALRLFADRAGSEIARLEAEENLRKREARLNNILKSISDGVWEIDAAGKTTYVNPRMEAMLQQEPGSMMGKPLFSFMSEEARRIAERNVERRKRGVAERHEFPLRRADGTTIWTQMATGPISDSDGKYAGALAVVTDISQERALDRRLLEAQKLEGLELLAAGIAHDFNNVLAAILAHVQLARRRPSEDEVIVRSLAQIERAAHNATGLTEQLRAYAGAATGNRTWIDLGELVGAIAAVLAPTLPSGVTIEHDLAPGLALVADRSGIEQVVLNLVTNARDALMGSGGTIRIRTGRRECDAAELDLSRIRHEVPAGECVLLEVEDDGPGIDDAIAARIFDPFFTTKGEERGLGLSIVRGVAKAHGAALLLDSVEGQGTRFTLLFPPASKDTRQPMVVMAGPSIEEKEDPAGLRLLIVDDDEVLRSGLAGFFASHGHRVEQVSSGNAALSRLAEIEGKFDMVFMDIHMADGDGISTVRRLRTERPDLPVVLMTGAASAEAISMSDQDPALSLLVKPFKPQRLIELGRQLRRGVRSRRSNAALPAEKTTLQE